ncbi:MAG: pantetheine-phosphate adenylyltransferase [Oscillospiraceae bacterium]|nr:pantetheine-phosphate adenylyltransferase [Oscillospiraceae bacterium]
MKIAICPGSFDPITLGHLDIIRRASELFPRVIVAVMVNSKKKGLFSVEERAELISRVVKDLPNVTVEWSSDLLAKWTAEKGDCVVVKGLRAISDFESEFQMALINRKLNPELETVFLPTSEEYLYLSSSIVREVCSLGGDISELVPAEILEDVQKKLARG